MGNVNVFESWYNVSYHTGNIMSTSSVRAYKSREGSGMENYEGLISHSTRSYGRIRVKLKNVLDSRNITRNRLKTLTGTKYDVIDRYYKSDSIQMVDLDFFAKVCCVLHCKIEDLLEYEPE